MPRSRLPAAARVFLAVIALVTAFAIFAYQDRIGGRAAVGRPAPGFSLVDGGGRPWRLSALRGHVVVLNFWASWCEVCTQEAPALEAFARRYRGRVVFLGIDWREPESALRAYVARHGLTYPNLRDADGAVAQRYGLTGVPETWFIGPHGVARVHIIGAASFEQLQADYRVATGRSIDGGGVGPVPAGARAQGLAWDGATLWVAGSDGLAAGGSGGRLWRPASSPTLASGDVRFIVAAGRRLYAGGPAVGLWTSADAGAHWRRLSLPPAASPSSSEAAPSTAGPDAFAADPADPARAWVWVGASLLRTTDAGSTWEPVALAKPQAAVPSAMAATDRVLWEATPGGVLRSTTGGRLWTPAPLWQEVSPGTELASPADVLSTRLPLAASGVAAVGSAVFFAGPSGIWALRGGGPGGALAGSPARAFAGVAPGPGGSVWAIAPNGDLYRAAAAGGPWSRWPYPS